MEPNSALQPDPIATPSSASPMKPGFTLQAKATVLVVGLTFVVTAATATYILNASGELSRQLIEGHIVDVAALLSRDAANVIEAEGTEGLDQFTETAMETGSVLYVVVSDPDGKPVAGAHAPNVMAIPLIRSVLIKERDRFDRDAAQPPHRSACVA